MKKQWLIKSNGDIYSISEGVCSSEIPSGSYTIAFNDRSGSHYLSPKFYVTDELVPMGEVMNKIIYEVENFWLKKDKFKKYNLAAKKGILLTGPPGTGKSSLISIIAKSLIDKDGLIFHVDTTADNIYSLSEYITGTLRKNELDRSICIIIENVDILSDYRSTIEVLINMMDGSRSVNNVLWLLTSNYPEKISELISTGDRNGRIDNTYEILNPDENIRRTYLKNKLGDSVDIEEWVSKTEDLNFSNITELIRSVIILESDTLDGKINKIKNCKISSSGWGIQESVGFVAKKKKVMR